MSSELPINPRYAALGVENVVLSGTSMRHSARNCEGWLSIKGVVRGSAEWEASGRRWTVNEDSFLILNDRHRYSLTMESVQPATTFCIFFARGFVEDLYHVTVTPTAELLNDSTPRPREFYERLEPRSTPIGAAVSRLYRGINRMTREDWEDQFREIATRMLEQHHQAAERAAKLPATRPSTRIELYRRVLRGRDFLLSLSSENVPLNALAREACLSPFHFHRSFTQIFGSTPHQYLTAYRMDRATRLLKSLTVTEVALESGFESPASFSSLFRRHYGRPPSAFKLSKNQ